MNRFEGKVALVTGAASGIGRATALRLASEGAELFLADLDEGGVKETAAEITAQGGRAHPHRLDVRDRAACRAIVAAAVADGGKLDVLCNVAGVLRGAAVDEVTEEEWDLLMSVNLGAVFFLSQAALPHLLATKGNIVNMASAAGLTGQVYTSVYAASKAAVVSLTKSMALEFAKRGVRVNAVCPGGVITPMSRAFQPPEGADLQLFARVIPLIEPAQPEEIASAVAYLASDEARFVTGTAFSIDGGQTAG
ncbi:MAG: short-chain dehydrogenase [Deltaproteobacteria bacterium]|jgi:meso-butanediol dehydrogenase/(S,S)-butanediol dehydrogenase/diacetyl reductase|nr:short-chain dehydrogenase [Deltaproteobacteria bacterium]